MASSLDDLTWLHGNIDVSDFNEKDSIAPVRRRTGRDPISAVKMPESLTAAVDNWAEAHHLSRSDAIRTLVELGLKVAPRHSRQGTRLPRMPPGWKSSQCMNSRGCSILPSLRTNASAG